MAAVVDGTDTSKVNLVDTAGGNIAIKFESSADAATGTAPSLTVDNFTGKVAADSLATADASLLGGTAVTLNSANEGTVVTGVLDFKTTAESVSLHSSDTTGGITTASKATDDVATRSNIANEFKTVLAIDVTTAAGAQQAIDVLDASIASIDSQRSDLGAVQNRFDNTIANLQNISENVSAARGRIQDTDFAAETANLSKNQILQQAGTAILAQAKQLPQAVLSLLQ
jgi:flagellin